MPERQWTAESEILSVWNCGSHYRCIYHTIYSGGQGGMGLVNFMLFFYFLVNILSLLYVFVHF